MQLTDAFDVRLAHEGEAGLLLDLMLRCWTGTVASNSTAYKETEETIAHQLKRGAAAIVSVAGEPVGAGRFYPVPGPPDDPHDWVEIKRVGVLREYRKHGLGPPLVAALETEAKRRGFPGAQLGVRHDQPRLVAFWASLGYSPASDVQMHIVNPLTPPPVTMRKRF